MTCSTRPGVAASWSPTAWVTEVTGMSSAKASPRVPLRSPAALLTMTTAEAPAAYACCALIAKVHSPRLTRAMVPTGKPAKSAGSQPGVGSTGGPAAR